LSLPHDSRWNINGRENKDLGDRRNSIELEEIEKVKRSSKKELARRIDSSTPY